MIRIGILGFAHGHINAIGTQWQEHPEYGAKLVAGWDHNPERGAQGCEKFGLEQFATVDALLSSDIDAVIITSETSLHAELVEQAAAAKKNILVNFIKNVYIAILCAKIRRFFQKGNFYANLAK